MHLATRWTITAPAIAGLLFAGFASINLGRSDEIVFDVVRETFAWGSNAQPKDGDEARLSGELARAATIVGTDPTNHEMQGVLLTRRMATPERQQQAYSELTEALTLRPTSPYTWLHLAEHRYSTGDTGAAFENALRRAVALGPAEPEIQRRVPYLGLAVYDDLAPETRSSVDRMILAAVRRDAMDMVRISSQRGRLELVCRLAQGMALGADPTMSHLCQGMGAKS